MSDSDYTWVQPPTVVLFSSHSPDSSVACIFGFGNWISFGVISVSAKSRILLSVQLLFSTETEITNFGRPLVIMYNLFAISALSEVILWQQVLHVRYISIAIQVLFVQTVTLILSILQSKSYVLDILCMG